MLLRAGLISLALLLLSRVLGVVRESAVAAGFGVGAVADWVVLLVSLPDWLTGVFVGGALSYVLVPHWARLASSAAVAHAQARVMRVLMIAAVLLALVLALAHAPLAAALAPGAYPLAPVLGWQTVWGVALSLPLALAAALWATRLQYEQDFVGVYGANVVVNLGLIAAIYFVANYVQKPPTWELFSSRAVIALAVAMWGAWCGFLGACRATLAWLTLLGPLPGSRPCRPPAPGCLQLWPPGCRWRCLLWRVLLLPRRVRGGSRCLATLGSWWSCRKSCSCNWWLPWRCRRSAGQ
jgi:putative peptidoglycan lipid II flippase